MWPESAARLLENSNRPIASRSIPATGDIGDAGLALALYTHVSTANTYFASWRLTFDWTIENGSSQPIDYRIYIVITNGSAYQIGSTAFTANASSQTTEAGENANISGGPSGNVTAILRILDDATSDTLYETEPFALVLPQIYVTTDAPFHNDYIYAYDGFEEARFAIWFADQVPTTSPSITYDLTLFWRQRGSSTSWAIEKNFLGYGSIMTTTNNNTLTVHARGAKIGVIGGNIEFEAYAQLIMIGTAPVQNMVVARFPSSGLVYASALPPAEDEIIMDTTVPTELAVQTNPDTTTANGYDGLLTEVDVDSLELTYYVDTTAGQPILSQTIVVGPTWDFPTHTFNTLSAGIYIVSQELKKVFDDGSKETIVQKIASAYRPVVTAAGTGYGTFFNLADHFNTTPPTIVENATYTSSINSGFDDTNNELEFIDTTNNQGPGPWGTVAVDIRPDPNPETWINWVPTWKDNFDMVMDFQFVHQGFPIIGNNNEIALDVQTTPDDYSQPYHLGCGLYYTGNYPEIRIKPTMMWYDRKNVNGNGAIPYQLFGNNPTTTYTNNTLLGTGDKVIGTNATRYKLVWKYRAIVLNPATGTYVGTLRQYINGYYQGEWLSSAPAEAYQDIYHDRTTNGLRVSTKSFGSKVYEYSIKRTAPHESQDRITVEPTCSATILSNNSFRVDVTSLTVNIPSTQYNVYLRHNNTIHSAPAGPYTAADINTNGVTFTITATMDGTPTVYEVLFRPSTWDSTAGVENYLGEFKKSEVLVPSFTSATASIANQTNVSFDIQLATLVADSGFTYSIDLAIRRSGITRKTVTGISFNNTSHTIPYTLYSPDRIDQDVDWWSGVTTDHFFGVNMTIKFGSYEYVTYTNAALTATIKPALIWRFKGSNGSLVDRDGHGFTWAAESGTSLSWDSTKLTANGTTPELRILNTNSNLSNKLSSLNLLRNVRWSIKMAAQTGTGNDVFNCGGWDPNATAPWRDRYFNLSMYGDVCTIHARRTTGTVTSTGSSIASNSYNFLVNRADNNWGSNFSKIDFEDMREYTIDLRGKSNTSTNSLDDSWIFIDGVQKEGPTPTINHVFDEDNSGAGFVGSTTGFGSSQADNYLYLKWHLSAGTIEHIYAVPVDSWEL